MRRLVLRVVLASMLLLIGVSGGAFAGATPSAPEPTSAAFDGSTAVESVDASGRRPQLSTGNATPETEFRIDLQSTRDADWTVIVRYELATENETTAFERVAGRFKSGEVGPSAELYVNLAAGAAEASGREMEIVDVQREAAIDRGIDLAGSEGAVGELRLSFTWTEFLREEGEQLVLDDAFRTADDETWLQSLGENQRMVIQPPEEYQVDSFPGIGLSLEDRAVVIEGPRTFEPDDRIAVVYSPTSQPVSSPPWLLLAGAVVLGSLVIAWGLWIYRRSGDEESPLERPTGAPDSAAERPTGETGVGKTEAGEKTGAPDEGLAGSFEEAATEEEAETEPEEAHEPDLSLLSDEERVERLLEDRGGRMRQATIVEETGWSDAKVSQLLSAMAEEGRIEKLRLGRENLISLPDQAPEEDGEDGSNREE
ncbi:hypothetical protein ACERIT_00335 [Halopenitus sp. H-Gu1]|uniref:helix-turn-helix transcriptional regulator n=1 Tax=Halopenitus sp. H-Gu1 TaxID=3242697 RepID=UPI00359E38D4